jgi:hypothetical protein
MFDTNMWNSIETDKMQQVVGRGQIRHGLRKGQPAGLRVVSSGKHEKNEKLTN